MRDVGGCWWQRLVAIPAAMSRDGAERGPMACSRPSPRRGLAQKDGHKQQLERLQAELEAERLRSQELRRRFAVETCELKEAAERDRQLLAKRPHSKWEQQQAQELQRLQELNQRQRAVEICQLLCSKEAELREVQGMLQQQRDDAVRQARDLQQQLAKKLVKGAWSSSEARSKLHNVLSKLRWETNGEQAAHIHRLEDELLLQRRCFLKCILERFEGEQPTTCNEARAKATAWHHLQTFLGTGAIGPCSLERLTASSSCDGEGQRKTCQSLKDARFQEEGNSVEVLLKAVGQDLVLHCLDSLSQRRTGSGRSVAEVGVQTVGQQEDWLPRSSHSRLLEQNAHLQSALKDLERQCSVLQEENCLLRKASPPEVREEWERLKQKTVKLGLISKQLQERARQLQTIDHLINTRVPLPIQSATEELCMTSFPQQRAGEMGEPARALLAWDEQDDFSQRVAEELQAQVAADEEGSYYVSTHSRTCEELQVQLTGMTNANTRLAEENACLCGQMGLTERATKASGRGADSAIQTNVCLQTQLEEAEHELKAMREMAERSQQLEKEHEETKLALQRKGEEVESLRRAQTEVCREHKETLQLFRAQVTELNDLCQKLKEQRQQLFQELEWLERERSNRIISKPRQAALGADKESVLLEAMRKQPAELRAFIARYSYDPFNGPNEQPELELPLVAGQYVYIFGDMDEEGWYVGELTDGTRGFVPSNFVEEVSDDDLMTPESPETSDW